MQVENNGNSGTLRANTHGHEQIICFNGAETPIARFEVAATCDCSHGGLENCIYCNSEQNSFEVMGDNQTAVAIGENIIGRQPQNGGNYTGVSEELAFTQNISGVMGVAFRATIRRLLPIECERLMGFPDNWTRIPWKGKPAEDCPDNHRYKACGNSMCVNVMRWLGLRIEMLERRLGR